MANKECARGVAQGILNSGGFYASSTLLGCTPSADVVKVVRCKNCVWAEKCGDKYECMHDHGLVELLDGNDFCSYGEAKE